MTPIGNALMIVATLAPLVPLFHGYARPLGRRPAAVVDDVARIQDPDVLRNTLERIVRDVMVIAFLFGAVFGAIVIGVWR